MEQNLRFRGCYCPKRIQPIYLLFILFLLTGVGGKGALAQTRLSGKVTDSLGNAIERATVHVKSTNAKTATDARGFFEIAAATDAVLVVTALGFHRQEVPVVGQGSVAIVLQASSNELEEVEINTGYQRLTPLQSTGAVDVVGKELLNRAVGPNIMDRIENLTTGISFKTPRDGIVIRGRASIFSDVAPLIVLDNFPYDGDIANINPNDIAGVSILKDAAAASIWGARAANGVIVITTKRGTTTRPTVSVNTNAIHTDRPDPRKLPVISSRDYVELEQYLFGQRHYLADIMMNDLNMARTPLTPVVETLVAHGRGTLSDGERDAQLAGLASGNAYRDLYDHFYRNGWQQQHSLGVSGDNGGVNYYFSAGYDRNAAPTVGTVTDRVTLKSRNRFRITDRLSAQLGITYTHASSLAARNPAENLGLGAGKMLYPYARLADGAGAPLPVVHTLRSLYTDTAGGGALLDWKFYPLAEIRDRVIGSDNRENMIAANIDYAPLPGLTVLATYQYLGANGGAHTGYPMASFYTRDLINRFSTIQPNGSATSRVPHGDIISQTSNRLQSHQGRIQLQYGKSWTSHGLQAFAGWEIKHVGVSGRGHRIYGYREDGSLSVGTIDFLQEYRHYHDAGRSRIPNPVSVSRRLERFLSTFANVNYAFRERYVLSATVREDAANLFGVSTNMRGAPHWSIGTAWHAHKEDFLRNSPVETFTLKASFGKNGNVSRQVSAVTTLSRGSNGLIGATEATIVNPPNADLRWEEVAQFNIGVETAAVQGRVRFQANHYRKRAYGLMGEAPIDPTLGLVLTDRSSYYGNVANMAGKGWDLELQTLNIQRPFSWQTTLLFSQAETWVTRYLMPEPTGSTAYLNSLNINPLEGKPVFTAYSYRWGGLDGQSGAPIGYLDGGESRDHQRIISQTQAEQLVYKGSLQPIFFGALRNTFSFANFGVSFNISFKAGHYFRRPSVNYSSLYGSWTGHSDYALRWQQPGDELQTSVPARVYPANSSYDYFYANAEVLTERAGHIRLEDVTMDYGWERLTMGRTAFRQVRIYAYARQLGMLWAANGTGMDPFYLTGIAPTPSVAVGLQFSL